MQQFGRGEIKRRLGEGGQGEVFLAFDTKSYERPPIENLIDNLKRLIPGANTQEKIEQFKIEVKEALKELYEEKNPKHLGALKIIRKGKSSADYEKAKERMQREVEIYQSIQHPSLLRLKDSNLKEDWFVTEYQPNGTLADNFAIFRGDLLRSLQTVRSIVEAVAIMHERGTVHRDIKPGNIFIGSDGHLILGDAGLVFFTSDKSRVTDTFENVGTRDYMPAWAMSMRIEEVRPSFDVFSIGKLIWSMVAGKPAPPLWYIHRNGFELEAMFPERQDSINWARQLLDMCVVEEEKDCLPDARQLLTRIDAVIFALQRNAQVVGDGVRRFCNTCGLGRYELKVNEDVTQTQNFGLRAVANSGHKIFLCDHCGHVQMFFIPDRDSNRPRSWPKRPDR